MIIIIVIIIININTDNENNNNDNNHNNNDNTNHNNDNKNNNNNSNNIILILNNNKIYEQKHGTRATAEASGIFGITVPRHGGRFCFGQISRRATERWLGSEQTQPRHQPRHQIEPMVSTGGAGPVFFGLLCSQTFACKSHQNRRSKIHMHAAMKNQVGEPNKKVAARQI